MRRTGSWRAVSALVIVCAGSQALTAEVTSLSTNGGTIGKYEKFEVTFTLSETYDNPFDPDIVDVRVTFHKPTGETVEVPAFFYRSYNIVGSNPETYNQPGPPEWKGRFAPSICGTWTFDIAVTDAGGTEVLTDAGSFMCEPSGSSGFIRIDPNDPAVLSYDDGSGRTNLGHNVAWNTGAIAGWENYLSKMAASGENWVRLWMCQYGGDGGVVLEENTSNSTGYFAGVGQLSMQTALRLDNYVETAEQNGVAIQLVFQHHSQYSTTVNPAWDSNPYNIIYAEEDGGFLSTPDEFFTNAEARRLTRNKYRYIVARWGYSPAIFAWELWNEVQFTDGWSSDPASVVAWHEEMANHVRAFDAYDHPVTTSSHGSGFEDIWNLGNIDIIQVHRYGNGVIDAFEQTTLALSNYGKCVMIGEFGAGSTAGVSIPETDADALPEPYRSQMYEALMLHNGIWSAFHCKSSAHLWWWDWYIDPLDLYEEFTALAAYTGGEDPADENLSRTARAVSGAEAVKASPLVSDFFAVSRQTVFTLENETFPGMENLSQWLHGSWQPEYRSDPTFNLEMVTEGYLKIHVQSVSDYGSNSLRVLVDSSPIFSSGYSNGSTNFVITVPLSAGQQSVQIENTGQDWFHISMYEFAPETEGLLDSIGLSSGSRAYVWVFDRDSQFGETNNGVFENEPVLISGLDDGTYGVDVYATRGTGGIIESGRARSSGGLLTYELPDFSKDIAVKVKPICVVDMQDFVIFAGQWLDTGPDMGADLTGDGTVDYADLTVLTDHWLNDCPDDWPF